MSSNGFPQARKSVLQNHGTDKPIRIRLMIEDRKRPFSTAPGSVDFGALHLLPWQISAVSARPEHFPDSDTYLLGINYDLTTDPDVPAPSWFEIGFSLSLNGQRSDVAVADAIPRHVTRHQPAASYTVNERLAFVPGSGDIHLPDIAPTVDLFGVNGSEVRWRHYDRAREGMHAGSYSTWATLVVPANSRELTVESSARFDFADARVSSRLDSKPATFTVTLPTGAAGQAPLVSAAQPGAAAAVPPPAGTAPRLFISYTHDDEAHKEKVRLFATFLAEECGFDVHLDRWATGPRRDWFKWAIDEITTADFVLIIASPRCRQVGNSVSTGGDNKGMRSELSLLMDRLHDDRDAWLPKLLPVVLLPERSTAEIPLFLQPGTVDYYEVADNSIAGAEYLLRAITGQPEYRRPDTNPTVVRLPTRP